MNTNKNGKINNFLKKIIIDNQKKIPSLNKYLSIAGITLANIFIIFPFMKKLYNTFYANNCEITHVVKYKI